MAETREAEKPMTQLSTTRFKAAEYNRNIWMIVPEHGTPFDAVLDPAYWAHNAMKLKPLDEILVHAEDGSYFGRLLVRDAGKLYAKVSKLEYHDLDQVDVLQGGPPIKAGYEVKFRGPILKWCAMRGKDCLKDGMEKTEAYRWLQEHLKTVES